MAWFSWLFPKKRTATMPLTLSRWKLQLPINSSGGLTGTSIEVKPARNYPPYFSVFADRWEFMCPPVGATTGNSNYPRTELRELTSSGGNAAWSMNTTTQHTLAATLRVLEVPERMAIAQIHATVDEPLKIHVKSDLSVYVTDEYTGRHDFPTPVSIVLGENFSYLVKANKVEMSVELTVGGVVHRLAYPTHPDWLTKTHYFKAGIYTNTKQVYPPEAKYRAIFTSVGVTH